MSEADPKETRRIRPQTFKLVFKCVNLLLEIVYKELCVPKTIMTMGMNLALKLWYTYVWILT